MKIAIASSGNTFDSTIDRRFGRCSFFVIYDTESKAVEFIPNPNKEAEVNAGAESVKLVSSRNVSKIIAGEFGIKIKTILDSLRIQMIVIKDSNKKIGDIINILSQ